MDIELLCIDGCPNWAVTRKELQEVLAEQALEDQVKMVRVTSNADAQKLCFVGSPSVRING